MTRQLIYRGATADFDTSGARLQTVAADVSEVTDPALAPGTYFYRVAAVDGAGNTSALSEAAGAISAQITRSFGEAASDQDYRLVALPGQADRSLASTLDGPAGTNWQAWWDTGADADFLVRFDGSDTFNFAPGRGFWLISTSDWTVEAAFPAVARSAGAASIALHDGWNIIANPLGSDVDWSAVVSANGGALQTLWQWDGSFSEATTFQSAAGGEAYYFLNDQGLEALSIPTDADGAAARAASPSAHSSSSSGTSTAAPMLTLQTRVAGMLTSTVRVGLHPEAAQGRDALDQVAPPHRFAGAHLTLTAPGAPSAARRQHLAHEWRPPTPDGHRFELVLRSAPGTPVQIDAAGLDALGGQRATVINKATGRTYSLNAQTSFTLTPRSEATTLGLVVGSASFVEEAAEAARPAEVALRPGYPNPFSGQTTLTYALPEAADVRVTVFDVTGRVVRTLSRRNQPAGRHRVQWDGTNQAGQPVASGLYLVRLDALGQQHTQKITRVR